MAIRGRRGGDEPPVLYCEDARVTISYDGTLRPQQKWAGVTVKKAVASRFSHHFTLAGKKPLLIG